MKNLLSAIGLKPRSAVVDNSAQASSRRLAQRLEQGAHQEAELLLSNASDENRERLIYGFASGSNSVPLAARWTTACSASSLAHTVLGASLIVTGWKIRGDSHADDERQQDVVEQPQDQQEDGRRRHPEAPATGRSRLGHASAPRCAINAPAIAGGRVAQPSWTTGGHR